METKKNNSYGERLDDYEDRPVPLENCMGWLEQGAVWLGSGFCLPAISLGGQIALGMGFWKACLTLFLGCTILTVIACLVGAIGAQTHLSSAVSSRFTFGIGGAKIFGVICAVSLFGWFGYQCSYFGQSAVAIIQMSTGITLSETLFTVIGGLAMMVTAIIGYRGIKALSNVGVPLLFVTIVAALVVTLFRIPFSEVVSSVPIGAEMSVGSGIVLVVGSFIVGVSIVPDFSRYSAKISDSTKGCILGYGIGYFAIVFMGMVLGYAFKENDITDILINQIGFGYIAAFVLIIATWTTNDNNLYSSARGITNAAYGIVKIPRIGLTVVIGLISTMLGALGIANIFVPFLNFLGVVIPPIAAVIIADFWIYHRSNYKFELMDRQPTFYVDNCIAALIGSLVGCTMNAAPYGFGVPFMMNIAEKFPSCLIAMAASMIAYVIIHAIHPDRRPSDQQ